MKKNARGPETPASGVNKEESANVTMAWKKDSPEVQSLLVQHNRDGEYTDPGTQWNQRMTVPLRSKRVGSLSVSRASGSYVLLLVFKDYAD